MPRGVVKNKSARASHSVRNDRNVQHAAMNANAQRDPVQWNNEVIIRAGGWYDLSGVTDFSVAFFAKMTREEQAKCDKSTITGDMKKPGPLAIKGAKAFYDKIAKSTSSAIIEAVERLQSEARVNQAQELESLVRRVCDIAVRHCASHGIALPDLAFAEQCIAGAAAKADPATIKAKVDSEAKARKSQPISPPSSLSPPQSPPQVPVIASGNVIAALPQPQAIPNGYFTNNAVPAQDDDIVVPDANIARLDLVKNFNAQPDMAQLPDLGAQIMPQQPASMASIMPAQIEVNNQANMPCIGQQQQGQQQFINEAAPGFDMNLFFDFDEAAVDISQVNNDAVLPLNEMNFGMPTAGQHFDGSDNTAVVEVDASGNVTRYEPGLLPVAPASNMQMGDNSYQTAGDYSQANNQANMTYTDNVAVPAPATLNTYSLGAMQQPPTASHYYLTSDSSSISSPGNEAGTSH